MNIIVRDTLERTLSLATIPAIALRIMQIAGDPLATSSHLDALIASDPPMAARTLRVVNSAYYGRSGTVSTSLAAIQLLGVAAVRNIAVAASLTKLFQIERTVVHFEPSSLWSHSVAVSVAARRIAAASGKVSPDEAMLAGLLHDIGLLLLMQAWFPEFKQIVETVGADPSTPFVEVERRLIGATHEEFGEALCAQWKFPAAIVLTCGNHHAPLSLPLDTQLLPAVVHVADVMAARAGIGYTGTVPVHAYDEDVLRRIGIKADRLDDIQEALPADVAEAMSVLVA